jgi:hypothetical protein
MTIYCYRLYLGTRVSNSTERTNTMRLDPHATPNEDRLAIPHDREGPGGAVKWRHPSVGPVMDEGS